MVRGGQPLIVMVRRWRLEELSECGSLMIHGEKSLLEVTVWFVLCRWTRSMPLQP